MISLAQYDQMKKALVRQRHEIVSSPAAAIKVANDLRIEDLYIETRKVVVHKKAANKRFQQTCFLQRYI